MGTIRCVEAGEIRVEIGMNPKIEQFARHEIKIGLSSCNDAQQFMFKRMYSHKDLGKDIDSIVDTMPFDQLDRALSQVERTIRNRNV